MQNLKSVNDIMEQTGKKIHNVRNAIDHLRIEPDMRIGAIRLYGPEKEKAILDYMATDKRRKN